MRQEYRRARDLLNIVGPPMDATIVKFSGGNRQKHVLGRWLTNAAQARLLVLCQPNQGVDIGARADIARALLEAAAKGLTVLVASSEVDEIAHLTARAYVCETDPWSEVRRGPDFERALMETLLAGVRRRMA
jgi:ABC-type sugar transport system ATPase subunit